MEFLIVFFTIIFLLIVIIDSLNWVCDDPTLTGFIITSFSYFWTLGKVKFTSVLPHEIYDEIKFWKKMDVLDIDESHVEKTYYYRYITPDFKLVVENKYSSDFKEFDLIYLIHFSALENRDYNERIKKIEQARLKEPSSEYSQFLNEFQKEMNNILNEKTSDIKKLNSKRVRKDHLDSFSSRINQVENKLQQINNKF